MAKGFANASRLCQTCGTGYSRSWGSTCVACSDEANQTRDMSGLVILFSFGFLFGILFYSGLVALRKRAFQNDATSKKRKKSMHSTMKRILLSHMQMLNTIIHLSVPWPEILIQILNSVSGVSGSFGDSANALECVYDNQSHSEFYLGALVIVAVLPFVFVGVLVVYWFCLARHSTKMGCGQTVEAWHYGSDSSSSNDHHHHQQLNDASPTSTSLKSATSLSSPSLPKSKRTSKRQSTKHRNFRATSMDALIMSSVLFWFMILPSILRMGLVSLECRPVQDSNGDERGTCKYLLVLFLFCFRFCF
jgi:heme/copper-type cytochrome/quinol oxidase subunit 2